MMKNSNVVENDNDIKKENNEANNNDDHMDMSPSSSEEVPEGLQEAEESMFPVGSEAVIKANHMPGMDGATATIDEAIDTVVYMVSYGDTDTGEEVIYHK